MLFFSPIAFAAGAVGWTFTEYVMHRFSGHKKPTPGDEKSKSSMLTNDFGPEHRKHHLDTSYFAPTARKLKAAAALVPVLGAAASVVAGPRRGISFALGFAAMYAGYEIVHRRIHTHAPVNAYARWTRKHHLSHHFNAKNNHGVTTSVWDHAFGTYKDPGRVRVPVSIVQHWMLDERGELRPEFEQDYELVGKKKGAAPGNGVDRGNESSLRGTPSPVVN